MKKIIALAVVGLFVSACNFDTRNDEASASTIKYALVTGRSADANGGPWYGERSGDNAFSNFLNDDDGDPLTPPIPPTPSAGTLGRILVLTTDGLLDGSSIEATDPTTCVANGDCCTAVTGVVNVTSSPAMPAGGAWRACYYPSSATTDDGASVYVFYSTVAPGALTASQPIRSGQMPAGDYVLGGSFKGKGGNTINWSANITVAP